ncbi:Cysteine-rich protein 2-binding protein [Rhodotorula sphaerocarpa]
MLALEPAYLPLQPVQMHTRLSAAAELQPPAGWTGHEASCSIAALRSSFRPFPVRTKSASPPPSDKVVPAKRPRTATPVRTEVRMIRRDDVDPVMRLQNACLPIAYPLSFYTTLMASPTSICLAAFSAADSTTPVGFVAAQLVEPRSPSLQRGDGKEWRQISSAAQSTVWSAFPLARLPFSGSPDFSCTSKRRTRQPWRFTADSGSKPPGRSRTSIVASGKAAALQTPYAYRA